MSTTENGYQGERFGAAESGPGSVASFGRRLGAFLLDTAISAMLTWAFTAPEPPRNWSLITWGLITVLGVGLLGVTPGQALLGIRVATLRPSGTGSRVGWWAVPRTVLVALVVPPLLQDFDGRGLHDRLCRTIVVSTR